MNEIQKLEQEMMQLGQKLKKLRGEAKPTEVKNYTFKTLEGETTLLDLFGNKEDLFVIHNMGQACRYCTLWADGLNPFVPHLEDRFGVVVVSKDSPEEQRRFANSRQWRFRMASHGGGQYMQEQKLTEAGGNYPGMILYQRQGPKIFRKNSTVFGPGDEFCALWPILSLGGWGEDTWTPQFNYWKRPEKLDDGGQNLK